jgi:hypothetical protein
MIGKKSRKSVILMSIIRGAAKENSVDKWYTYDQQFRLRVSKDDTKKWRLSNLRLYLLCEGF